MPLLPSALSQVVFYTILGCCTLHACVGTASLSALSSVKGCRSWSSYEDGLMSRVHCHLLNECSMKARLSSIVCDCAIVSTGCQRFEVLQPTSYFSWRVRICADLPTPRLPREALEGRAHWARWAWRLSNPWELAAKATEMFSDLFPEVYPLQALMAGILIAASYIIAEVVAALKPLHCIQF